MINVPNILCIGFAKCGTTTLYDIFKQHPDIYLSNIKEPLFWGKKDLEEKGFNWYLERYYSFANKPNIMEINPMIAKNKEAKVIKQYYGENTKIILILRNPIYRLYSNFKMNLIDGSSFSLLADNVTDNTSISFENWLCQEYIDDFNGMVFKTNPRMSRSSNYYNVVKDYMNQFGIQNVKIVFFEDLILNTQKVCENLMDFIGVSYNTGINFNIHANEGNRVPYNICSVLLLRKLLEIIFYLQIHPIIKNELYDDLINNVSWKLFDAFSARKKSETLSDFSYNLLSYYYSDLIKELSDFLNINLFLKWNIIEVKDIILKRIKMMR